MSLIQFLLVAFTQNNWMRMQSLVLRGYSQALIWFT